MFYWLLLLRDKQIVMYDSERNQTNYDSDNVIYGFWMIRGEHKEYDNTATKNYYPYNRRCEISNTAF